MTTTTTTHRSAAGGWISAASAARETEALTRALAISISGAGGGGGWEGSALATSSLASSSSLSSAATPTSSDAAAAAISPFLVFDHGAPARAGMAVQEKRIKKKRRSRAKQVDRTVYITTDPANFRRMVQQVTGIQVGPPAAGTALMPPEPRIAPVLPTLDTSSAFAMERAGTVCGSFEPGLMEGGAGFGLEALMEAPPTMTPSCHYPTLESWTVM